MSATLRTTSSESSSGSGTNGFDSRRTRQGFTPGSILRLFRVNQRLWTNPVRVALSPTASIVRPTLVDVRDDTGEAVYINGNGHAGSVEDVNGDLKENEKVCEASFVHTFRKSSTSSGGVSRV